MMKTVKGIWNDLYDNSLEVYKNEDEAIRNLSMILHILNSECKKATKYILQLKSENEVQAKEISIYKQKEIETNSCKKNNRTPLKSLTKNYNEFTPQKSYLNHSVYFNLSDNDNILNHQISECDANLSKENDNSLFIDDSVEDFELTTSPTLNKHKNRHVSRTLKLKQKRSIKNTLVLDTPNSAVRKSKKFKHSIVSDVNHATKLKNCTVAANDISIKQDDSENDETLFIPKENINNSMTKLYNDTEMLDMLEHLKDNLNNKDKNVKLDNSYDCLPEVKSSPDFICKKEVVRKKSERVNLAGWHCEDCEKYYSTFKNHISEEELRKRMDQCSKHKYKFNPNILTPQGFWNPEFSPTQDSVAFNIE